MTVTNEPNTPPLSATGELIMSLDELLHRYTTLLGERAGAWGKDEENVVRRARIALTNAGYPPELGHEITAHLDYAVLDGSN
ncbi:MAG: hypothetical protein H7Y38_15215 [Armatimonadetes bacterium]|nr:hypothetical protein [Armatimonadota bacterium]